MKNLKLLSIEEQKNIQGGDWIKKLGAAAKKLCCDIRDSITSQSSGVFTYG